MYPKDAGVFFKFTMANLNPGSSLRFNTHWSAPPVSALARFGGPRKMSQSPVSRTSNIERYGQSQGCIGGHQGSSVKRRCQLSFVGRLWPSTESATSGQSATSQYFSALPGRLGRRKFVLDGLGWKDKNQRTYYSYTTTAS